MFKGIRRSSLIDFPGLVCATLFTGGCNFDCPWCHNRELVDPHLLNSMQDIPEDMIREFLVSRRGKLQGVCVTGGEPTLWGRKLGEFFTWCKDTGLQTKLDTNGYLPDTLAEYLDARVLDFVAMDLKNIFPKYSETANLPDLDLSRIKRSVELIRKSGVPHQFRTTVVPGLVVESEVREFFSDLGEAVVFQEYREPVQEAVDRGTGPLPRESSRSE